MRSAVRRLPKFSTACINSSADRFNRFRVGGAFLGIALRFPGFNWRPVQSSSCMYSDIVMNRQPLFGARRLEHFSRVFFRFSSNSTGANQPASWPYSIRKSFAFGVDTSSADLRSAMRSRALVKSLISGVAAWTARIGFNSTYAMHAVIADSSGRTVALKRPFPKRPPKHPGILCWT